MTAGGIIHGRHRIDEPFGHVHFVIDRQLGRHAGEAWIEMGIPGKAALTEIECFDQAAIFRHAPRVAPFKKMDKDVTVDTVEHQQQRTTEIDPNGNVHSFSPFGSWSLGSRLFFTWGSFTQGLNYIMISSDQVSRF
jgi:hypothetical protein